MSDAPRIYLITGPDVGKQRKHIATIRTRHAHNGQIDVAHYYAFEFPVNALVNALYNPSLFGGQTLVIYHAVDQLRGQAAHAALKRYCASPAEQSILVLQSDASKLEYAWKKNIPKSQHLQCWKPTSSEIRSSIAKIFVDAGLHLTTEEFNALYEALKDDESEAVTIARQIVEYRKSGKEIDDHLIAHIRGGHSSETIFTLIDALFARNRARATEIAEHLQERGEDTIGMTTLISRSLNRLWQFRCLRAGGNNESTAFRAIGVHWFNQQKIFRNANGAFGGAELSAIIRHTSAVLNDMRTAPSHGRPLLFTALVMSVCEGIPPPLLPDGGPSGILWQSVQDEPM